MEKTEDEILKQAQSDHPLCPRCNGPLIISLREVNYGAGEQYRKYLSCYCGYARYSGPVYRRRFSETRGWVYRAT